MPRIKAPKTSKAALVRKPKVKHSTKKVVKRNRALKRRSRSVM